MTFKASRLGLALLALHQVALALIASQEYEGSWGGFLLYLLDAPVSFIYMNVVGSQSEQWIASAVLGGAWWYTIGLLIAKLASRISTALKRSAKQ